MPELPARPSMEHLRKQAKRRRREHRIGLARAEHEVALSYGFASWPRLVRHVNASALTGIRRALALADPRALRVLLEADTSTATARLDGLLPLIVLLRDCDGAPRQLRSCVELLLAAGADPSSAVASGDGEWQLTASYFAVERQDLAMLRLLIEAGAEPDDDAFYHACERGGSGFLDLLYRPGFEEMVNHKLDFEDEAGLSWFLDQGVDVNTHGCLHWAIGRGRSVTILRHLIAAGADIDLPHPDLGVRPLAAAARCGHLAAFDLLTGLGATAELDPVGEAMLAVARGRSVVRFFVARLGVFFPPPPPPPRCRESRARTRDGCWGSWPCSGAPRSSAPCSMPASRSTHADGATSPRWTRPRCTAGPTRSGC
jgi:hypothetical protein